MAEVMCRLVNVAKSYERREVCHIDRLDIFRGEILGIMGPSGAGKSTLLRLLNFLDPATSGTILFNNYQVDGSTSPPLEVKRKVTMVFQNPVLLNSTVATNVAYGLTLRGRKGVKALVRSALEEVGLSSLANARAATLSGGEAQRVALARALITQPELLLLDEPTANLDPSNVAHMENLITTHNREHGTTIVLVTHNVFQARRLTHRTALLLEGRIVEWGQTEQVFTSPRHHHTAAFIKGEMVY